MADHKHVRHDLKSHNYDAACTASPFEISLIQVGSQVLSRLLKEVLNVLGFQRGVNTRFLQLNIGFLRFSV